MTARRDLLDDAFAAFIDENATGIGLPASERHYRQRPSPFAALFRVAKSFAAAMATLADAFTRYGRVMAAQLEAIATCTRSIGSIGGDLTEPHWPDAARWPGAPYRDDPDTVDAEDDLIDWFQQ